MSCQFCVLFLSCITLLFFADEVDAKPRNNGRHRHHRRSNKRKSNKNSGPQHVEERLKKIYMIVKTTSFLIIAPLILFFLYSLWKDPLVPVLIKRGAKQFLKYLGGTSTSTSSSNENLISEDKASSKKREKLEYSEKNVMKRRRRKEIR